MHPASRAAEGELGIKHGPEPRHGRLYSLRFPLLLRPPRLLALSSGGSWFWRTKRVRWLEDGTSAWEALVEACTVPFVAWHREGRLGRHCRDELKQQRAVRSQGARKSRLSASYAIAVPRHDGRGFAAVAIHQKAAQRFNSPLWLHLFPPLARWLARRIQPLVRSRRRRRRRWRQRSRHSLQGKEDYSWSCKGPGRRGQEVGQAQLWWRRRGELLAIEVPSAQLNLCRPTGRRLGDLIRCQAHRFTLISRRSSPASTVRLDSFATRLRPPCFAGASYHFTSEVALLQRAPQRAQSWYPLNSAAESLKRLR